MESICDGAFGEQVYSVVNVFSQEWLGMYVENSVGHVTLALTVGCHVIFSQNNWRGLERVRVFV